MAMPEFTMLMPDDSLASVRIYFHSWVAEGALHPHPTKKNAWLCRDKASLKLIAEQVNVTIEGL